MRAFPVEATITIDRDDEEITLTVEGSYTPGDPGNTWGLPEDCWPPEPAEAEVHKILNSEGKPFEPLSPEEEKAVYEKAREALSEAADNHEPDPPDEDD